MPCRWRLAGILSIVTALSSGQALGGWEPAVYKGEGQRSVQGCASKYTDESFLCVLVRCDRPNDVGLYVVAAGLGALGTVKFVVDEVEAPVSIVQTVRSPIPDGHRAVDFPASLRAAMKTGRMLRIAGAGLSPGYDAVSLKGAGTAIARIERGCGLP